MTFELTHRKLTKRQQTVCDLVVLGLSNVEISCRLGMGRRTVEAHRAEIFRKKGVRNAVELVRKVILSENGTSQNV